MSTRAQIAYDFDEPIYPWYDLAHARSVRAGITNGVVPTTWAPHEAYGVALEDWVAVLDAEVDHGDMYTQAIDPAIVASINQMFNYGFGVHIITARGQFGERGDRIKDLTRECIDTSGVHYDTLNFARDKVGIAKELGVKYMIDDAPHNVDPLREAGIDCYLLDERWNREHPAKHIWEKGGYRVNSLFEFNQMILLREMD